jgi:membrane AbrB-like protein
MADDLGADARVVAVLQYLRLLVVLVTMPVVVALVFRARADGIPLGVAAADWRVDVPFVAAAVVGGLLLGRLLRLPSAAILGPLLVAALLTLVPYFQDAMVPPVVEALGYLVIGVQVGLKFTASSLRAIGRMLPTALLTIVVTLFACAGLGWVLTVTTEASPLDAYLATTPGGIYAVLGVAAATDGDVAFVAATQMLRLLIVLASAPVIGAYLRRTSS